jgi:AP-4 complex subunit sigma-1
MLDKYFGNVCELDLMFSIDISHHILDEMVINGHIVETNRANVLKPVRACLFVHTN